VRALAAEFFVADATAAQVALGQAAQVVRLVHLQHVALQHGVVGVATHLNAVVGKHMAVVLDVLAQLERGGVLQPRLQARQHLVARELGGHVGVVVCQGHVGGLAWLHADGDAHDLGTHLV